MAGVSKAVREQRAKEQKLSESRSAVSTEAFALGGLDWMEELHQMGHDEDADRLHTKFNRRVWSLEQEAAYDQGRVDKFVVDVQQNAAYAFEWGDAPMAHAARVAVTQEFLGWYKAKGPDAAYKFATDKAMNLARNPSRSTSQAHNVMHQNYLGAWAKLVDDRKWATDSGF